MNHNYRCLITDWLIDWFLVVHLLLLVLFPRDSSSILVLLNVIPSINPSPHFSRSPHWSVTEDYEGGCLCRATKQTSYYKTGKSRPDEAWKHSFPKAPLKFAFTDTRGANKYRPGTTSLLPAVGQHWEYRPQSGIHSVGSARTVLWNDEWSCNIVVKQWQRTHSVAYAQMRWACCCY